MNRHIDINDVLVLVAILVLVALSLAPGGHAGYGCGVAP